MTNTMYEMEKNTKEYPIIALVNQLKNNIINRKAEMQRSYVWGNKEQTEYLDTLFHPTKYYASPLIGAETERTLDIFGKLEFIVDLLDGVQRSTTLEKFLNNEIKLGNNITPVYIDQLDGTRKMFDIAGKTWQELPDEVKNLFMSLRIEMIYFKHMSYEERERQFLKLNAGKKLNNAEMNKARIGQEVREFVYSQLLTDFWSKMVKITNNRDIKFETIVQIAMLLTGERDLSGKTLARFSEEKSLSNELFREIEKLTAYMDMVAKEIKREMLPNEIKHWTEEQIIEKLDDKQLKKWVKPIEFLKKVNVPIVYIVAKLAIDNDITAKDYSQFINSFYNGGTEFDYYRYTSSNSADSTNVQGRINTLTLAFRKHFNIPEPKNEVIPAKESEQGNAEGNAESNADPENNQQDIQNNDQNPTIQDNETQDNETQDNETQDNETQDNETQDNSEPEQDNAEDTDQQDLEQNTGNAEDNAEPEQDNAEPEGNNEDFPEDNTEEHIAS